MRRITVRRLMACIAIAAVALLGLRACYKHQKMKYWLQRVNPNPVTPAKFMASAARHDGYISGQPIPILVEYDFRFSRPQPPDGVAFVLSAEVSLNELTTGTAVAKHAFQRTLATPGRMRSAGKYTWQANVPRPGEYGVCRRLTYVDPLGRRRGRSGGTSMILRVMPPSK